MDFWIGVSKDFWGLGWGNYIELIMFINLFFSWLASSVGSLLEIFGLALRGGKSVFLGSRIRILGGLGAELSFDESSLLGWFWGMLGGSFCELGRW